VTQSGVTGIYRKVVGEVFAAGVSVRGMKAPAVNKLVRAVPLGLIVAAAIAAMTSAAAAPAGTSAPLATNVAALATPDQQAVEALAITRIVMPHCQSRFRGWLTGTSEAVRQG
jgi:DNA polymerase III psi subunit